MNGALTQRIDQVQAELSDIKTTLAVLLTPPHDTDFFQPGCIYRSNDGLHLFDCRAVTPHPDPRIGEDWAIGWHYADGTWHVTEFAPDWWKRGWTVITGRPPEPER